MQGWGVKGVRRIEMRGGRRRPRSRGVFSGAGALVTAGGSHLQICIGFVLDMFFIYYILSSIYEYTKDFVYILLFTCFLLSLYYYIIIFL